MVDNKFETIYEFSKAIYKGEKDKLVCQKIVFEKYGISKRSFEGWYVPMFRYMIEGKVFKGNKKQGLTKYFLKRIYEDFGVDGLRNALKSYRGTIDYYKLRGENKPGDEKIYEEFIKFINVDKFMLMREFDEVDNVDVEGLRKSVFVNIYERNSIARKKCIEVKGCSCVVCGFNFEQHYGDLGKDFIHAHHIVPISSIRCSYIINYETDLVPVCPNCHAMLHRGKNGKVLSVEELKRIIEHNKR